MKKSNKPPSKSEKGMKDSHKDHPDPLVDEYMESLSEVERSTMKIAEEHLKTSYSLKKSIGYIKWLAARSG